MNTPMTPEEAKSIISSKITSLDWRITSIREPSDDCTHFRIESSATIPHLTGVVILWSNKGQMSIYCGGVDVLFSIEQSHIDHFRSLFEKHKAQEIADRNRIIIETATALQSL